MARAPREVEPGICFHIINRGNNRQKIFQKPGDYAAFLAVLTIALGRFNIELLAYCLMPDHWHLIIRARPSGSIPNFMRWLTLTHVRRHHEHYEGETGHLYQGRYKSFPVEEDDYFLVLCRYVESNALRSKMVARAELWEWASLHQRQTRQPDPPLAEWPVDRPKGWLAVVNEDLSETQMAAVGLSLVRGRPLGSPAWVRKVAARLKLEQTLSPRGRPRKPDDELSPRHLRRRRAIGGQKDK